MNLQQSKNYPAQLVFINGQQTITNSLIVADYFGKRHSHVLRKIDEIIVEAPSEFTSAHFWANVQNQQVGTATRDLKCYHLTKDGFMFLVMGFTGTKAAQLKINFINAFNEAQARLSRTQSPFERQRMLFTWDGGKIVSSMPLDDDHFVTKREKLVNYIREPRFLSLEQLIEIQQAAGEQIAQIALIGRQSAKLVRQS
ncbi:MULTISPECIES: Rha family transcriptional regulator [unclassified Shewanella]|uniref:Rha family transcriptional regulator n=1 Tax=unclassified Shewanella TaxID=196818 RepID=UPI0021D8FBBD|nr:MULTISPECIES: Rha family transcriptional regulator [unclassified Shewanella]MCU8034369.1 Rha family transcriptional regulator [Shewanella sp. SM71]MCU8096076.1 Rha family transcriptional regulator [Shewanella sp. SM102]